MADGIAVEVTGLREFRAALRRMDKGLAREMAKVHHRIAETVIAAALPNVPVGATGKLKASVRAGATVRQAIGRAGSAKVPYAAAIHWGEGSGNLNFTTGRTVGRANRNIPARPFLWAAAQKVERQVIDIYGDAIDDLIDRVVR